MIFDPLCSKVLNFGWRDLSQLRTVPGSMLCDVVEYRITND